MSVRTMARVWAESKQSGSHLLMLLAIADFADDAGTAYPSVVGLAEKCRMKTRNANYILATLQESGELRVHLNQGPKGKNLYQIVLPAATGVQSLAGLRAQQSAGAGVQRIAGSGVQPDAGVQNLAGLQCSAKTPAKDCSKPLQPIADEPSLNHQGTRESVRATRSPPANMGSRLPENWSLPADYRSYCEAKRPDLDPDETAEAFKDFWLAKAGKDARKANWLATWRGWVRKERAPSNGRQTRSVFHADDVFQGAV